jgi:enamine deaminase RidA (YjgF/YER057c/UK114 family)
MSLARHRTPAPGGASYADAVVVEAAGARWIYVAGQTPRPDEAGAVPADLGGQTERCFDQIARILRDHGATLADVVQVTSYLIDLERYAEFAGVRKRRLGDHLPASAAVGVASLLDGALVELVAVAVAAPAG